MACGADTSQYQLRYIEEVTAGTAPATGDMQIMRTTGVDGGVNKTTTTSDEIRSDRQVVDVIMTKKEGAKGINGEFSYDTYDDFLEAALFTDWSNIRYRSDGIGATVTTNIYDLPGGHGLTFLVGQLIAVAGFTSAANNGLKEVTAFSGNDITVAESLVTEAAGNDVTIQVVGYTDNDVEVTTTSTYELATGHGLTFITGQSIRVAGFTDAANNGIKTVSAFSGDLITVEETLVVEAAGDQVVIKWDTLSNGITKKSFTIEDDFTDVGKVRTIRGLVINTMAIDAPKDSKITVATNFIGQSATVQDASVVTGTPIAANSNEIMNTGDHVGSIVLGGSIIGLVDQLSFEINNNVRGHGEVGSIENTCVASGRVNVTGTFNIYFQDWTIYQLFLDNTASSLRFPYTDSNGTYQFNIPRIKVSENEINSGGPDQDVIANGSFEAMLDTTTGLTMIVTKMDV